MEKQIIYGVFSIDIKVPEKTDKKKELEDLAEAMKSMNKDNQHKGSFIRAYKKLEDAVAECCDANGWHLSRTLEVPDGVQGGKVVHFYYPMLIEVNG